MTFFTQSWGTKSVPSKNNNVERNNGLENLTLITTEKFGDIDCDFYKNAENEMFLTRMQIGRALNYSDPQKAIDNIHSKHRNRLNQFSVTLALRGADGKFYDTTLYSQIGVMEICRWSQKPKADIFMDWVWNVVEKYRKGELTPSINLQPLADSIAVLTTTIADMQQDIYSLKESQNNKRLPNKKYSRWKAKAFEKLRLLHSFVNSNTSEDLSLSDISHIVINEVQDTYDIDINEYRDLYKCEFDLDENPYPLDVVGYYKDIRDMFNLTLDNIMERLHIDQSSKTTENIFDVLARKLEESSVVGDDNCNT